jgi:divalent metal cation (Fe/Co/Zn/Cd) transporter
MTAEIHVKDGLDTNEIEALLDRVTRRIRSEVPDVVQTFIELHPEGRAGHSD